MPLNAGPVVVRALRADEQAAYRAVRLAALAESPSAFTATFEGESAMPDEAWDERVRSSTSGATRVVVAEAARTGLEEPALIGLAAGIPEHGRARVVSVWVDPRWRGQGVAAALIEQVCTWAAGAGYGEIQIETVPGNDGARRLYERLGFRPSDLPKPPGCDTVLLRHLT